MPEKFNLADLNQFCGTSEWYRHSINRAVTYTEGVKYLAEHAGAYWLIDEIAIENMHNKRLKKESMQVWKLRLDDEGNGATLLVEDGNYHKVFEKRIEFTDFPAKRIDLWWEDGVILLPGEH